MSLLGASATSGGDVVQVDLRRPTIVIAGAFNPAIFAPEWLAAVLHEIPEGTSVEATMVADTVQKTLRAYIQGIGISVEPERLTAAWDELSSEANERAEQVVRRAAEALPHTPANGIGVNFHFQTADFGKEVANLLYPADEPTKIGPVQQTVFMSKILTDDTVLTLSRTIANDQFVAEFNFHHSLDRFTSLINIFDGRRINLLFQRSKEILETLYDLDVEDIEFLQALSKK